MAAKGPKKPAPNATSAAARVRRGPSAQGLANRSSNAKAYGKGGKKK